MSTLRTLLLLLLAVVLTPACAEDEAAAPAASCGTPATPPCPCVVSSDCPAFQCCQHVGALTDRDQGLVCVAEPDLPSASCLR